MIPLKITAILSGPVADYLPMLDGLLIEIASHCEGRQPPRRDERVTNRHRPNRCNPAPDPMDVPEIPLKRTVIGNWPVYHVSSPVYFSPTNRVDYFGKRIGTERAGLLHLDHRKVVTTSNTWTKSYRLPVRVINTNHVVWFACGDREALQSALASVTHLGRKPSHGWGVARSWNVEEIEQDYAWFAPDETGRNVLMRPLPLCPDLPQDLDGWKLDYGAVCPPYWHRDRYCERVEPC